MFHGKIAHIVLNMSVQSALFLV